MRTDEERNEFHKWVKEVNFSKLYVHPDIKYPPNQKFILIDTEIPEPPLYKIIYNHVINKIKEYYNERK